MKMRGIFTVIFATVMFLTCGQKNLPISDDAMDEFRTFIEKDKFI